MISMDSLDAVALCPRCGCLAQHANPAECIDALRCNIAELEFKRTDSRSRSRQSANNKTPGRYAGAETPAARHLVEVREVER
jgi:hypothetical protein